MFKSSEEAMLRASSSSCPLLGLRELQVLTTIHNRDPNVDSIIQWFYGLSKIAPELEGSGQGPKSSMQFTHPTGTAIKT